MEPWLWLAEGFVIAGVVLVVVTFFKAWRGLNRE